MENITNKILSFFYVPILYRYILRQFFGTLFISIFTATSLFLVIDLFERMRIFIREDASFISASSYMLFKIPSIIHIMIPVAVLISTLLTIGRLSQLSEITAMRAGGASVRSIATPLILVGLLISFFALIFGETIVPYATQKVEDIYHIDIRKKIEKGDFSKQNFWYRRDNSFFNVDLYDSRTTTLKGINIFKLDESFKLKKRVYAPKVTWNQNKQIAWTLHNPSEFYFLKNGKNPSWDYKSMPLMIEETPSDFYNMKRNPQTMNYFALKSYVEKLQNDGIPVTKYLVDLAAKFSTPFLSVLVVIIAIPFSLQLARTGSMTKNFVTGVCIGFSYYFLHAFFTSLGSAELIPVVASAWAANVIIGCVGMYLLSAME